MKGTESTIDLEAYWGKINEDLIDCQPVFSLKTRIESESKSRVVISGYVPE